LVVEAFCSGRLRRLVLIYPIDDGIHQIRLDLQQLEEPLDSLDPRLLGDGVTARRQVVQVQLTPFILDLGGQQAVTDDVIFDGKGSQIGGGIEELACFPVAICA
jgi:hypothetical protein